jgi:replicative DNA helicase
LALQAGATETHVQDKINHLWRTYAQAGQNTSFKVHTYENSREDYTNRRPTTRFLTGYSRFNTLIREVDKNDLVVVGGRPGLGKTNWLINLAKHYCEKGLRVLLISTEIKYSKIWERYGTSSIHPEFMIHDESIPLMDFLRRGVEDLKPDILIFDHINDVSDKPSELSEYYRGLKRLAMDFDMPVFIASQLNREADYIDYKTGRKAVPRLSMLKGTSTAEQIISAAVILDEISNDETECVIAGHVVKARHGERGIVKFLLKKNPYRFVEIIE